MNDDLIQAMKPSQVITQTIQFTEYNLYLHGEIGGPDDFMEHFAVYKTASEGDIIRLYINSLGGSLSTGMEYIRHMRECEANIVAVLGVEVASMASAVALEANDLIVDDMSTMLVHSFSYGAMGTEHSIYNQATFNKKLNERWIRTHYSNFLDESQLQDALKGVDILLDSDEIKERWGKLQEYRQSQPCDCGSLECTREKRDTDAREDCCPDEWGDEIVSYKNGEPYEDEGQIVELLDCVLEDWNEGVGKYFLSISVTKEVYDKVKGKSIQIVVDSEEEGGA